MVGPMQLDIRKLEARRNVWQVSYCCKSLRNLNMRWYKNKKINSQALSKLKQKNIHFAIGIKYFIIRLLGTGMNLKMAFFAFQTLLSCVICNW